MEKLLIYFVMGALVFYLIILIAVFYKGVPDKLEHGENKEQLFLILADEGIEIEGLLRLLKWHIFWEKSPPEPVVIVKETHKRQIDVLLRLQKNDDFFKILILEKGQELPF